MFRYSFFFFPAQSVCVGGFAVSKELVILCGGFLVPEKLINTGPVCMLHTHFECLVRCARFLICFKNKENLVVFC